MRSNEINMYGPISSDIVGCNIGGYANFADVGTCWTRFDVV